MKIVIGEMYSITTSICTFIVDKDTENVNIIDLR